MNWYETVEAVAPHVFKIESPSGHGTGFFCYLNADRTVMGIATAKHVVDEENKWQQPIRISNYELDYSKLLTASDRVVLDDETRDSAILLFNPSDLQLPEDLVPLLPVGKVLKIGAEVGWVGFPAVEPNTLCFFSGNISAHIRTETAYLIDGVAINGVSGGPVFHCLRPDGKPEIIGIVTAYTPNRTSRETLPGLAVAQDVGHVQEVLANLNSLQEAAEKKDELETELQKPKPSESEMPQAQTADEQPPATPVPPVEDK